MQLGWTLRHQRSQSTVQLCTFVQSVIVCWNENANYHSFASKAFEKQIAFCEHKKNVRVGKGSKWLKSANEKKKHTTNYACKLQMHKRIQYRVGTGSGLIKNKLKIDVRFSRRPEWLWLTTKLKLLFLQSPIDIYSFICLATICIESTAIFLRISHQQQYQSFVRWEAQTTITTTKMYKMTAQCSGRLWARISYAP